MEQRYSTGKASRYGGDRRDKADVNGASASRQRLQTLEGQPLGILDPGKVEPADEGDRSLAIAIGQRDDGVDRNSLGFHGASLPSRAAAPAPEA